MAKILAFAGSNSSQSINYKLVQFTVEGLNEHNVQLLNLANFPFPMYSEDYERENGFSNSLIELKNDIAEADGLIIAVNEHNSTPSAYFKNLLDWLSKLERFYLKEKPIFLMSTSRGKRGGKSALEIIKNLLPRFGANVVSSFSLPLFSENLEGKQEITDAELAKSHQAALQQFLSQI